jgi:monoamine oxidase
MIAKPALENGAIRLSTEVTRIETRSNNVKVFTKDGSELGFDKVVMTAPLGYLKQHKDIFVPPLPSRLSQAIDSIGYGSLEKV